MTTTSIRTLELPRYTDEQTQSHFTRVLPPTTTVRSAAEFVHWRLLIATQEGQMDANAPHDDLHDHPDIDFHLCRTNGKIRAVIWIYGRRIELEEVTDV